MIRYEQAFIGGEWVPPATGDRLDVESPSTGEVIGSAVAASPDDVDRAVAAARRAFDRGPWPRLAPAERAAAVEKLSSALAARTDELTRTLATEVGTPISTARPAQVDTALEVLDYYAELGRTLEVEQPVTGRHSPLLVRSEPVGVVAAVIPWNVPLYLTVMKLAPALVAGCTIVVKAAPETPLHAHHLAEALAEVGLPPGVVSILAAGREVSEHLVSHPGVDKVAFTGSTATGRRIAAICGQQLKRVTLELGGKSAAVVLPDADLDAAVAMLVLLNTALSGQICVAQSRVLVPRALAGEVADRARAAVESLTVGDALDESVLIPYDSEDEAVDIANDSPYGLHGTVWTRDVERGADVGRRIRTGTFSVNGLVLDPAAPFGGMKASGIGRELGPQGLAAYLEPKTISIPAT